MNFALNGQLLPSSLRLPIPFSKFFPAASLMTFQHIMFNFGNIPYKYPPQRQFFSLNENSEAAVADEKRIVPRLVLLEQLQRARMSEDDGPLCQVSKRATDLPAAHYDQALTVSARFPSSYADLLRSTAGCGAQTMWPSRLLRNVRG